MANVSNRLLWVASTLWVLAVFLWPVPTNLRVQREVELQPTSVGEGLYKSEITEANFGLLGVRFFESAAGRRSWRIDSDFAELHRNKGNYAYMKGVKADFFSGATDNIIKTKSDYGRSHFDKRLVELEGNVVVRSQLGYRFTMNRLDYHGRIRHFRSNDTVQMSGPSVDRPDMYVTGTGLDGNLENENFIFKRNTRARRRLSTDDWIRIQSVSGEFQPSSQRAVFTERVKAQLPQLSVESDRLEMNIGDTRNELLKATGHVVLYHKNRRGVSERADIEIGNDKVILEGRASIKEEDNELTGRRITLYTSEDRVEVEQAEGNLQR